VIARFARSISFGRSSTFAFGGLRNFARQLGGCRTRAPNEAMVVKRRRPRFERIGDLLAGKWLGLAVLLALGGGWMWVTLRARSLHDAEDWVWCQGAYDRARTLPESTAIDNLYPPNRGRSTVQSLRCRERRRQFEAQR